MEGRRCEVRFCYLYIYRVAEGEGESDRFSEIGFALIALHLERKRRVLIRMQGQEESSHDEDDEVVTKVSHFSPFLYLLL